MAGKQTPSTRAQSASSHVQRRMRPRRGDLAPDADANATTTEETRRSGRANKGQHTKNQDALDEPAAAPAPKPKSQPKPDKKGPAAVKSESVEQDEEEASDGEEAPAIYRCVCGEQRDIRGRQMICCDNCDAWQHNKCLELPEGDYWDNRKYYCEQCKPEDHQELLAAMARGEKPWARKKGAKSKAARHSNVKQADKAKTPPQSTASSQATPAPTKAPTPAPVSLETPEASNGHADTKDDETQPQSPTGEKRRHEPSAEKATANKKRRKSSHHESKAASQDAPVDSIDALPALQKILAERLRDTLAPLITHASDTRGYRIPDGETAKSLANRFALQISHAALAQFGEPTGRDSQYSAKVTTILFNVKKNEVLVDQLLSGGLKAEEFVAMEPEEMASEEKQREYAVMREAAEKQMILTEEAGPRIRKTHKGEEIVGEEDYIQEFKQPNLRERDDVAEDGPVQSPTTSRPPESPANAAHRPLSVDTSAPTPDNARRPSTNFDINSVFDKVRSPQADQQAFLQRRQSSLHTHDKQQAPVDDADVDRLLKDEDNDVEMSGYSSDPTVCWQGTVSMQSIEPFDAVARFVAGGDFGQVVPWDKLLSSSLSIQGRIESSKGDDYIRGIGHSESHDVAILAISPVTTEGRAIMDNLYNYFHSRGRWGVVPVESFGNDILRDLYIIPIEAGGSNLPPFIDMLEYCTIETPRKEHMMLVALVAKLPEVKPQLPATQHFERYPTHELAAGQTAQQVALPGIPTNGPSPSPIVNPHGPQFSPVGPSFPPAPYGNPYAQPPVHNGQQPVPPGHAPPLPPPPHHQIPRALEILGPYINSPVIVQILGSNLPQTIVSDTQLINMRHIVETIPEARTNISVLTQHLTDHFRLNNGQPRG
ncbi:hypothetical protein IQ07DRAFT_236235 [Pyrenochaeta sp. DS3sAY3a]|nr:hypothetical protein IQ07DRAFT_236235 [Pyrenochaeta sp. DS3sAY3a]